MSNLLYLIFSYIYTKLKLPKARLLRFPIDIRGGRYIDFGKRLTTGYHCRIEAYPESSCVVLRIGEDVQINDFVHIAARRSVIIGSNVLVASKVFISDIIHGSYTEGENESPPDIPPARRQLSTKPVFIGDNVWIGESVSILPGVSIGKSSIIGANSVVTKNIPDYCIAVGNPARIMKKYNFLTKIWERNSE